MRIGSEAPGRRAHSVRRHEGHGNYRVAATSDRQARAREAARVAGRVSGPRVGTGAHRAGCRRMPAGTSPVVTMRHKAIRSLRASATIMVLRAPLRPPSVRARYHLRQRAILLEHDPT